MRQLLKREDGFTLIEVMVAAIILVVAFTSLAVIFIGGQSEASADVEQTQLISIADQQIEQIRGSVATPAGFLTLGIDAAPTTDPSPALLEGITYANPNDFTFGPTATGPAACFDINSNYDNIVPSQLASESPAEFTQWSYCGTYGEPLTVLGASPTPLIKQGTTGSTGVAASPCPRSGSAAQIYSPCSVQIGASTSATYFNIYTFVTDTYVGCGGTTAGNQCPTIMSSQVSGCTFTVGTASGDVNAGQSNSCADSRRVTVAVVPATNTGANHKPLGRVTPVYLSAIFSNPNPTTGTVNPVGINLGASL